MNNQQEIATPDKTIIGSRKEEAITTAKRKIFSPTRRLAYSASLVAITYILKLLGNYLTFGALRITVSYIGFFISAIVLGPVGGGCVVVIADVVSQLVGGIAGMPNPLIALGNFGGTVLFGLLYYRLPVKSLPARVLIAATAFILWATLGFNSLANYLLYYKGTSYIAYMLTSRAMQLPVAYLNAVLTVLLVPQLRKCGLCE